MPFTAAQHRAHRAKRKAEGFCTRCLKRPARHGMKTCQRCVREVYLARRIKIEQAEANGERLCHWCYHRPATHGGWFCAEHHEMATEANKRLVAKYIAEGGRCHQCFNKLDEFSTMTGRVICPNCNARYAANRQRRRMRV